MRRFSWAQACGRRLARHGLDAPLASPADVARAVVGLHGQMMPAAELAVGVRTRGTTRVDVRHALWGSRELVKTYGPRGTVHVVAAADLERWCAGLMAAPWAAGRRPPAMRLTDEQADLVVGAVDAALAEADLTVDELDVQVVARTGPWAGDLVMPGFDAWWPRWRQMIPVAAYHGALCFAPDRDRRTVYTSPRRWLPGFTTPRPSLEGLLLDYLHAYGPATTDQLAQWLGVPATALRSAVAAVTDRLEEVDLEGAPALLPAGEDGPEPDADDDLRLLPYFDPYVVGAHPRSLLFPGAAERALNRGQAGTRAVMLVGGTVAGIWHYRRSGRRIEVTAEPFTPLTARLRRRLDDRVGRVGEILEATPTLHVGEVTSGRHL